MNIHWLHLHLESDLIVTDGGANAGAHKTLTYVPGSNLLGAAAAYLHSPRSHWTDEKKWLVFHSGKVRFLPAYPLEPNSERTCVPVPASLRCQESKLPRTGEVRVHPDYVLNLAAAERFEIDQPIKLPAHFVGHEGRLQTPNTSIALKSSTMARRRDPQLGGLFAYEALNAEQSFYAAIHRDADVPSQIVGDILEVFTEKPVRLGRSRHNEFGGAVKIHPAETQGDVFPTSDELPMGRLTIYALTDLALRDPTTGSPTLSPVPQLFGLPAGVKFEARHSWLEFRRYSPFNGFRRRPDLERQVIARGSVLVFMGVDPSMLATARRTVRAGIGDYRTDGLGQVVLQPRMLLHREPETVATASMAHKALESTYALGDDAMLHWLEARDEARDAQMEAARLATTWCETLKVFVGSGVPSSSQWNVVRQAAAKSSSSVNLRSALFAKPKEEAPGAAADSKSAGVLRRGVGKRLWETTRYLKAERKEHSAVNYLELCVTNAERSHSERIAKLALEFTAAQMSSIVKQANK